MGHCYYLEQLPNRFRIWFSGRKRRGAEHAQNDSLGADSGRAKISGRRRRQVLPGDQLISLLSVELVRVGPTLKMRLTGWQRQPPMYRESLHPHGWLAPELPKLAARSRLARSGWSSSADQDACGTGTPSQPSALVRLMP